MCGILALLGLKDDAESWRSTALACSKLLRHRGPDWTGVYCKDHSILAHERLAIVSPESGDQPLYSMDGTVVLAVNGEIYNYEPIKKQLLEEGFQFKTASDCEIIIPLYEKYGVDFLDHVELLGMYAFVLYDEKTGTWLAARDHVGIIPLYHGHGQDGSVWFSSELKALQEHCPTFGCFQPGHYMTSQTMTLKQFYKPSWENDTVPSSNATRMELREAFEESVKSHLMSDVPYGVLLSGGLDSSLVASIMSRSMDKTSAWPRLHSFCIGLRDSPDLKAARKVADFLGTVHHEYTFTVQEGLDAVRDVIYHTETYDVTSIRASTPMFLMARLIKASGVKMVLSGEGADEMFGGYLYFHKCPSEEEFQKESVSKVSQLHYYDCLRANKTTMAWGVEARVPFLDRKFLDFAMEMSPRQKMCLDDSGKSRIEKFILRSAFDTKLDETPGKAYLPDEILWRQKEQFSDGVGYSWIDGLKAHADKVVSDSQLQHASCRFPINTPRTKEAYFIRQIFSQHFPSESAARSVKWQDSIACSTAAALRWDASFQSRTDDSGRSVLGVHKAAYSEGFKIQRKHE